MVDILPLFKLTVNKFISNISTPPCLFSFSARNGLFRAVDQLSNKASAGTRITLVMLIAGCNIRTFGQTRDPVGRR